MQLSDEFWLPPTEPLLRFPSPDGPKRPERHIALLALDPGGMTGWSIVTTTIDKIMDPTIQAAEVPDEWWHGEIDCRAKDKKETLWREAESEGVAAIEHLYESIPAVHVGVVIEDFLIRRFDKSRPFLSPVRLTAALDQLMFDRGVWTDRQTPADAMKTCTDDRLKQWDFYVGDGLGHARDADRHMLLFIRRLRSKASLRRKVFPLLKL
jgi:hypothetical protein